MTEFLGKWITWKKICENKLSCGNKLFVQNNSPNAHNMEAWWKKTFFTEQLTETASDISQKLITKLVIFVQGHYYHKISFITNLSHFHCEIMEENVSSELWGTKPSERCKQVSTKKKWISYEVYLIFFTFRSLSLVGNVYWLIKFYLTITWIECCLAVSLFKHVSLAIHWLEFLQ